MTDTRDGLIVEMMHLTKPGGKIPIGTFHTLFDRITVFARNTALGGVSWQASASAWHIEQARAVEQLAERGDEHGVLRVVANEHRRQAGILHAISLREKTS